MKNPVEIMASSLQLKPHSFDHIRSVTGLKLTDGEFLAMVEKNGDRFQLVRVMKRNEEGVPIRPGRVGVRLRVSGGA